LFKIRRQVIVGFRDSRQNGEQKTSQGRRGSAFQEAAYREQQCKLKFVQGKMEIRFHEFVNNKIAPSSEISGVFRGIREQNTPESSSVPLNSHQSLQMTILLLNNQSALQENVDITNMVQMEAGTSQLQLDHRFLLMDQSLKSGKIKSIRLRNFMCHANFSVDLNKNVNVFVGLNGSGKSAILTALAIGLGSKASSTSRSANLKDLVKRGEASASIEITLTNDGIDSFEGERC
jgi:signal recognition particle GTPase